MKCYNWNPVELSKHLTMDELVALQNKVQDDPKSKNPAHDDHRQSIWLYTKAARKKLDAIGWAITYKLQEARDERATRDE